MSDVGGPGQWPVWTLGYQPTTQSPLGTTGRVRVPWGLRFEADEHAVAAQHLSGIEMDVFRDGRGRWCVAPKEEPPC